MTEQEKQNSMDHITMREALSAQRKQARLDRIKSFVTRLVVSVGIAVTIANVIGAIVDANSYDDTEENTED